MKEFLSLGFESAESFLKKIWKDESGVGVIELVLILVVLIGLVTIFKSSIEELLGTIFDSIQALSGDIL